MRAKAYKDNKLAIELIDFFQQIIHILGYQAKVHFELEGCYQTNSQHQKVNFNQLNQLLHQLNIEGEIIREYWHNQWEFVSRFANQTPLKEANNLALLLEQLPLIFQRLNYGKLQIKPVVWSGDQGKLASGSKQIFSQEHRAVHIPNAIQMNISVATSQGENLMANEEFGLLLQQSFLDTSLGCSLLYLPEEEAFERFALKTQYGLLDELCSPNDISGGHQGSIAFYQHKGKHNQDLGIEPLLYSLDKKVLLSKQNWQETARIEHRLGAASLSYNAFNNVLFGLLNVVVSLMKSSDSSVKTDKNKAQLLPTSLYDQEIQGKTIDGAISLFQKDTWFAETIDQIIDYYRTHTAIENVPTYGVGQQLKKQILAQYQPSIISRSCS